MSRISFAAFMAATITVLSAPAFAQGPAMAPDSGAGKPGAMTNGNAAMNTNDAMPMTCQGMMDKAHPMMDNMADSSKKSMAMKQVNMANSAMSAGKEKTCMSHMKMAMHDMM